MNQEARQQKVVKLRRRLWVLRERLKDLAHDPALNVKVRREKNRYYVGAIAEARAELLALEGH